MFTPAVPSSHPLFGARLRAERTDTLGSFFHSSTARGRTYGGNTLQARGGQECWDEPRPVCGVRRLQTPEVGNRDFHLALPTICIRSAINARKAPANTARTLAEAHSSVSLISSSLCGVPTNTRRQGAGASVLDGGDGRALHRGRFALVRHAEIFGRLRLVQQPVQERVRDDFYLYDRTLSVSPTAPAGGTLMAQQEFGYLGVVDGPPTKVDASIVAAAKTYRQAVRACWTLRRAKGLTAMDLAREFGFNRQHVSDYLNPDDKPTRRNLPAEKEALFQEICGNSLLAQWHAAQVGMELCVSREAKRAMLLAEIEALEQAA